MGIKGRKETEKIKVIVVNKPSAEEVTKKTKELKSFLESIWFMPIKTK